MHAATPNELANIANPAPSPRHISAVPGTRGVSMGRNLILTVGLFAGLIPAGTFAQEYRKTVTVEVYLPEALPGC